MERREATAEASLAAMRERMRLGMAIAAITRITATTINNSIRENPFCLRSILMKLLASIDTDMRPPKIHARARPLPKILVSTAQSAHYGLRRSAIRTLSVADSDT